MNVLVLGWYHHRNAGDDRILRALERWLDGHTLGVLPAGRPLPTSFARRWDVVLVGGGGLLQRHGGCFRDLARFVRRVHVPVALVGVSAEHPEPALVAELRRAAPRLVAVWLRDEGSRDELGLEGGHVLVGPDLTWLDPVAPRPADRARRGVAVAWAPHGGLDPAEWGPALAALPPPVRPWPFWFEHDADPRALGQVLPDHDVPSQHDLRPLHDAQVVVSARYHGLVFGLQAGRPVVGIGDAPKVRRLLHEQGLADWHVPADRVDRLGPVVSGVIGDGAAADARAAAVGDRLRAEALDVAAATWDRVEATARPLDGRSHRRRLLP